MLEIPDVNVTVNKIYEWYDSKEFIKDLYDNILIAKWDVELYNYFSEVYDNLFSNLLLKHTYVSKDTKKMLEILATPIFLKSEKERNDKYDELDNM